MPNSKSQYERFLAKKAANSPVSWGDVAARIDNEEPALFGYMADNDFAQLWMLLHHSDAPGVVGKGMSFTPDKRKAIGELKLLLIKRDFKTLNDIISHYRLSLAAKNYTTEPELIRELENLQTIAMRKDGKYGFNIKLS